MPGTYINDSEIDDQGTAIVKTGGNLYIKSGRKHIGKTVRWFVMKGE